MEKGRVESRRSKVLGAVRVYTESHIAEARQKRMGLDAGVLSGMLGLDRANVSKELNGLYKDGQMIKLLGKPTLYLHRATLCRYYPQAFLPATVPKGKDLREYIVAGGLSSRPQERAGLSGLDLQVGMEGSLRDAVFRAKAAVLYPPAGLHTLITGGTGAGKTRFARMMYHFAVSRGTIAEDAPFILCNCQEYEASPQLLLNQIFGRGRTAAGGDGKSQQGLLEKAAGGILCLHCAQHLSPKVQDHLIELMEKNVFTRMGESSPVRYNNAMLVITSSDISAAPAIQRLQRSIPMHIQLPQLDERGKEELLEYAILFFQRETTATGVSFHVHRDVLMALLCSSYPGNVAELMSTIKAICSMAYLDHALPGSSPVNVNVELRHFPASLLNRVSATPELELQLQELLSPIEQEHLSFYPNMAPPWVRGPAAPDARARREPGIPVLIVFHGRQIAESTAEYLNSACCVPIARGVSYLPGMDLEQLTEEVCLAAKEMDRGSGILIVTDMEPLGKLDRLVCSRTGVEGKCISHVSLPALLTICRSALCCEGSVQELAGKAGRLEGELLPESFIERAVKEILASSLTFLDPAKAASVLLKTLERILTDLHLSYTDEVATKFVFHCSHMLERLIRGESLRYDKLKVFTNEHSGVFLAVESAMSYPAEVFGITMPASELAYVAELFLPLLEEETP